MGVSYSAILAVGKEFEDRHEAESFLRDNGFLAEFSEEDIDDNGLGECLPDGMGGSILNYYNGYGFYLGFDISCHNPESFAKDFAEGMEEWDKLFPDTPADVVHTVRVS